MWAKNITSLEKGIFRTINGNADELIAVGRCIKAGFYCSMVENTNGKYDAVIDPGNGKLLRVQIKGTSTKSLGFTGGSRSGQQISRIVARRTYKYSPKDCDLILGINSNTGECFVIPIGDIQKMGNSCSLNRLEIYKENWNLLKQLAEKAQK